MNGRKTVSTNNKYNKQPEMADYMFIEAPLTRLVPCGKSFTNIQCGHLEFMCTAPSPTLSLAVRQFAWQYKR